MLKSWLRPWRQGTRPGTRYYKCPFFSSGQCIFFHWREGSWTSSLGADGNAASSSSTPCCCYASSCDTCRAASSTAPASSDPTASGSNRSPHHAQQEMARANLIVSFSNTLGHSTYAGQSDVG